MKATQYLTFTANGQAIPVQKELTVTAEKDEPRYLESDVINLYPGITYQTIDGFGAAMTGTSAHLFAQMDEKTRKAALKAWFVDYDLRFLRVSLDSCDYSLTEYQAVEDPIADPNLDTFSIKVDKEEIIPMLKEAMEVAGHEISVLVSPWSPPKQWKTCPSRPSFPGVTRNTFFSDFDYDHPNRNRGGSLKPEYYGAWAKYVCKFIKSYLDEGINVTMVTIQNEPCSATPWDSCTWTAEQEKTYLRDFLYPTMKEEGLLDQVGIFIWDHSKERILERASAIIDDVTDPMIAGIAFHGYTGDHFDALRMTAERFPGKTLMLSEICGLHMPGSAGGRGFGFVKTTPASVEYDDAILYSHDIIGDLNNGMHRWIDWNLIVDEQGGPRHVGGGFTACMIADPKGSFYTNICFAYLGHFTKFIHPGAKRIGLSQCDTHVDVTAALNPDGKLAVVVLNHEDQDTGYCLRINGQVIRTHFPAHTISSIVIEL